MYRVKHSAQKTQKMWLQVTTIALMCSLMALVVGTALFAQQAKHTQENSARQVDLNARLRQLQTILVTLGDAETGQRGYLLTGKVRYLLPYRHAVALIPEMLKSLDHIPILDADLDAHLAQVRTLTALKLAELGQTIQLYDQGRQAAALQLVQTDVGQDYAERLRTHVTAVLNATRSYRDVLNLKVATASANSRRLAILIVSTLVASVLLVTVQVMMLIKSRHRYEDALQASQNFLQRTGRIAGIGGWEVDLATGFMRWSDEVRRIHDVADDFVPTLQNVLDFYPPDAQDTIREALHKGRVDGIPWDIEVPSVTATGRRIYIRTVGEAERDASGKPRRMVGALQDITERKALQDQLAENERFAREITDSLPVRIAYFDSDRRFQFINQTHCQRFKKSRSDIIGRTRTELVGDTAADIFAPHAKAVLSGERQRFEYEELVDGEMRNIESQLIPHVGMDGAVMGYFSTGIDITERKAIERALRDLTQIFDHTPDFIAQTDVRGNIHYLNPSVRQFLGLSLKEPVEARSFAEFSTPETMQRIASEIYPAVQKHGVWLGETTVYAAGQRVVPVNHMVIAHRDEKGRIARYSAVMRDISIDVHARNQLQIQTATLSAVVEAIPAMVAVLGADLRYRLVNTAFERWRGLPRGHIVGHLAKDVVTSDEHDDALPWALRALAGESVGYEKEYPAADQSRYLAFSYIPLRLQDGSVDGFIVVAQDITPHREEEMRLLTLSERDALTGLLNRAGFESYLARKAQAGGSTTLALLYIDLDYFKPVNDTHGHPTGDKLLRLFAERLQRLVRPTDAVARLGGDEFAVVLYGVRAPSNAELVGDKIIEAAQTAFEIDGLSLRISASVGIAFDASGTSGWKGLVERADAQLYVAKAAGRGKWA